MSARAFFESLWSEPLPAEQEEPTPLCRLAAEFQPWAETLVTTTVKQRNIVSINQAKILLLDKYFEWRSITPRNHRDKISSSGHICIWHVFEAAYYRLREAEISITPPLLFVPQPMLVSPPPAPPQPPQIAGIFIGEEE